MSEYSNTLKMNRTRKYPTYQFYYRVRYIGETADVCMHYAVLLIESWLREKTGVAFEDTNIEHIVENFRKAENSDFQSKHIIEGYVLDITSILEEDRWAMKLREPDANANNRIAVAGRFIETEVGLHILDEEWVEIGIQINAIDPETAEELPYGFRPAFVMKMFTNPDLQIFCVDDLPYNKAIVIDNEEDVRRFEKILNSKENFLPMVCFTETNEKVNIRMLLGMIDEKLGSGESNESMLRHFESFDNASQVNEIDKYYMVYEPDRFTKYSFGYARAFYITHNAFPVFCRLFSKDMDYGDVIWLSPRIHSDEMQVYAYKDNLPPRYREVLISKLLDAAHMYSKNKQYKFGNVLFEYSLRSIKLKVDLEALKQRIHTESEKEIYGMAEEIIALNANKVETLEKENCELKKDKFALEQRVSGLESAKHEFSSSCQAGTYILKTPEINELYPGEINDLIISVMNYALNGYAQDGSRAKDLLEEIIQCNPIKGIGKEMFDRVKEILSGTKNVTESDISSIERLGFTVSRLESGHYKVFIEGGEKYFATIPGTGSDVRGMKNSLSDLLNRCSVY